MYLCLRAGLSLDRGEPGSLRILRRRRWHFRPDGREAETEPDLHRPGLGGAKVGGMVRIQHAPVARHDRQVHGGAEPPPLPPEVSASRAEEHPVLVQEQARQMQEDERGGPRGPFLSRLCLWS